jgi:aromatic-L-amino-acid decarboxylase
METEESENSKPAFAPQSGDMSAEDFRRFGYEIVDRIADYFQNIEQLPVLSQIEPNWLKDNLPKSAPETGEDFQAVLADIDKLILPAVTNWNHPNFHGLFSTSTSSVGVFGEMLAAAFDMKAMLWRTSPASTELEEVTLDWLRQMMNLPADFKGIIYDTASGFDAARDCGRARTTQFKNSRRRNERQNRFAASESLLLGTRSFFD